MVKIRINGQSVEAEKDLTVLEACLKNNFFVPNLCFLKTRPHPHASCRLCFVQIEGYARPVTSCTEKVRDGMSIFTDTPEVKKLQKTSFKLLMSLHPCHAKVCPTEKPCLLMRIAKHLGVGLNPKPLEYVERGLPDLVDFGSMYYVPGRCVLCARCIHTCRTASGKPLLTFALRGFRTMVAYFKGDEEDTCVSCRGCIEVCPVGALIPKESMRGEAFAAAKNNEMQG